MTQAGNGALELTLSGISSIISEGELARGDTTPKEHEEVKRPTICDASDSIVEIEVDSSDVSMDDNIND